MARNKKNKKKGFTLVELIGVVAVLAIVSLLATTAFIGVRKNVLKKDYENIVTYIETQAAKYAENTGITYVNVEQLIEAGYIEADDEKYIRNPENSEILNCYYVDSTYENGSYTSKLTDINETNENGSCKAAATSNIGIFMYDTDQDKWLNIDKDKWYTYEKIILGVRTISGTGDAGDAISGDNITYQWNSNQGFNSKEQKLNITVDEGTTFNRTYQVVVTYTDSEGNLISGSAVTVLKADRQAPTITTDNIEQEDKWVASSKKVTLSLSDGSGSGIYGVYSTKEKKDCSTDKSKYTQDNLSKNIYTENLESGEYRICIMDNATPGNTAYKDITVTKTDTAPILDDLVISDNIASSTPHTSAFTISFTAHYAEGVEASEIHFEYRTAGNNISTKLSEGNITVPRNIGKETYYIKACNESWMCSEEKEYVAVMQYTLTYDTNTGDALTPTTKTVIYGESYKTLATPKKTGYTFKGWYTARTNGTKITESTVYNIPNDSTIFADWEVNIYTITLDVQNGNGGITIYEKYNTGWYSDANATTAISTITIPTKSGYIFDGYYTGVNGTGTKVIDNRGNIQRNNTSIFSNEAPLTGRLYAKWLSNSLSNRISDDSECVKTSSSECWYKNNSSTNYFKYINARGTETMFRIYHHSGNKIYIIYNNSDNSGYYGQTGKCHVYCCNAGTFYYSNLYSKTYSLAGVHSHGNFSYCSSNELSCLNNPSMDTNLDTFYNNIIGSNVIFAQFNTVMHVGTLTSNTKSISRIISLLSYNEYKNIANCNGSSCNGNYLTNTNFWLADGTGSKSTSNYYVSTNGSVSTSTSSLTIKPTLMATNVVITGGSGSSSDPYVVYYDNRAS